MVAIPKEEIHVQGNSYVLLFQSCRKLTRAHTKDKLRIYLLDLFFTRNGKKNKIGSA